MATSNLRTIEKIKASALRIIEEEGVSSVSMRRIAKTVGITPMAIYHHYKDRGALLETIAEGEFNRLAQDLQERRGGGILFLEEALEVYVDYALSRPHIFDFVFSHKWENARRFPDDFIEGQSPTLTLLSEEIERAMDEGLIRHDDKWEVALSVWGHMHGLVMLHRGGRIGCDANEFRALCQRSLTRLIHGLKA